MSQCKPGKTSKGYFVCAIHNEYTMKLRWHGPAHTFKDTNHPFARQWFIACRQYETLPELSPYEYSLRLKEL